MDRLVKALDSLTKPRFEETSVDRLNYTVTSYVLILAALAIFAKDYGGDVIQCYSPYEFTSAWEQYAHDICFVENTYWLPLENGVPTLIPKKQELTYYQWVPFMLALQALMFYVPHFIWRALNLASGIELRVLGSMAKDVSALAIVKDFEELSDKEKGELPEEALKASETVKNIVNHLYKGLKGQCSSFSHSNPIAVIARFGSSFCGSYITFTYLMVKAMFVVNVMLQLHILNGFLGKSSSLWGLQTALDLSNSKEWEETGMFPRVTICKFDVRVMGTIHNWVVQCVLRANMFNEKIFLALWVWLSLLVGITVVDATYWLFISIGRKSRQNLLRGLISSQEIQIGEKEEEGFLNFCNSFVGGDGTIVFRLMISNAGEHFTAIVVSKLWKTWLKKNAGSLAPNRDRDKHPLRSVLQRHHSPSLGSLRNRRVSEMHQDLDSACN